jgi:hypothetical protein
MRRKCKNLSNSYEAGRNCRTTHDAISPKNVYNLNLRGDVCPARNRWTVQHQLLYSEYHSLLGMQLASFTLVTCLARAKRS